MKRRICSAIAGYRDEIADFTAALVSIPTENPPGRAYEECARAIASKLRQLDLPVKMREISPKETLREIHPATA